MWGTNFNEIVIICYCFETIAHTRTDTYEVEKSLLIKSLHTHVTDREIFVVHVRTDSAKFRISVINDYYNGKITVRIKQTAHF